MNANRKPMKSIFPSPSLRVRYPITKPLMIIAILLVFLKPATTESEALKVFGSLT